MSLLSKLKDKDNEIGLTRSKINPKTVFSATEFIRAERRRTILFFATATATANPSTTTLLPYWPRTRTKYSQETQCREDLCVLGEQPWNDNERSTAPAVFY